MKQLDQFNEIQPNSFYLNYTLAQLELKHDWACNFVLVRFADNSSEQFRMWFFEFQVLTIHTTNTKSTWKSITKKEVIMSV